MEVLPDAGTVLRLLDVCTHLRTPYCCHARVLSVVCPHVGVHLELLL